MDEYYCPNCGAILNYQLGFDPSCGTWTCTSCGNLLMDDDIYEGDRYQGVAWYCDDCGALLNRQCGFSDVCESWTCTECGHVNSITDDNIYDSEEDYKDAKLADSIADLLLNVINCGIIVHKQKRQLEQEQEAEMEKLRIEKKKEQAAQNALRWKRTKAFLFHGKKVKIGVGNENLIGKNVSLVCTSLKKQAFSNVKTVPIKDIYTDTPYEVGQVAEVSIDGVSCFQEGDLFRYNAKINVVYHEKMEITIPFSERNLRRLNYIEAGDRLQELGFTEIYEEPIRDLVTGWITPNGSVEKITIGKTYPFKKNDVFPYDVRILIEYHTFKKK